MSFAQDMKNLIAELATIETEVKSLLESAPCLDETDDEAAHNRIVDLNVLLDDARNSVQEAKDQLEQALDEFEQIN